MGRDLQVTHLIPKQFSPVLFLYSWMRNSDRTWKWPCSRNTSSRGRRALHWLWTDFSKRCGSETVCLKPRLIYRQKVKLLNITCVKCQLEQMMSNLKSELSPLACMSVNIVSFMSFFSFVPALASSQFKCCGSHNSSDWTDSVWIQVNQRLVPDSCCKTPSELCGRRDHPSNIYREEVGKVMG